MVIDRPMNGEIFLTYVLTFLLPTRYKRQPKDIRRYPFRHRARAGVRTTGCAMAGMRRGDFLKACGLVAVGTALMRPVRALARRAPTS